MTSTLPVLFRYDMGIQSFDTADAYSKGMSEVVLGKAIKEFNLPREEIVVMTKVQQSSIILNLELTPVG